LPPHQVGDRWIDTGQSAILRVPSVVIPNEFIHLLNPSHPDFSFIVAEIAVPFTFDERLFQKENLLPINLVWMRGLEPPRPCEH
jgi:hypothetical protein